MTKQKSSELNSSMRFRSSITSSKRLMRKLKNLKRTIKTSSTREIFLEPNSLEETMNSLFSMKRLRFFKALLPEVRSNTKKDWRISDFLNSRLEITRVS
jgi:hypothetical protein